ncbi:BQ5605_C055g12659 [Microbotryum silenes-dioicae]|uniref:BQ5605_C055g12659 protein n=1 Tax=Microbotryum silenes-dioicae TaxID=796604 RepID=A0A2X0NGA9_9BASI|nr:BQ5605_C055g12659 [Microbotryum silenes-dioicae]
MFSTQEWLESDVVRVCEVGPRFRSMFQAHVPSLDVVVGENIDGLAITNNDDDGDIYLARNRTRILTRARTSTCARVRLQTPRPVTSLTPMTTSDVHVTCFHIVHMRHAICEMQLDLSQLQLDVSPRPDSDARTVRRRTTRLMTCPTLPSSTPYN